MELRKCLLIFIFIIEYYLQIVLIEKEKSNLKMTKVLKFFLKKLIKILRIILKL